MGHPLAPGSVSLGVYVDPGPPDRVVAQMFEQAGLAAEIGVDGVTISEHHAGFPTYMPNPLQVAGWILDRTEGVWAGPNPMLLPLPFVALIAEELVWLDTLHPGRVAAGLALGYVASDFECYDLDFDQRGARFAADGLLAQDPAIAARTERPIPLVAAAGSMTAARRATTAGTGVLTDSLASVERLQGLFGLYAEAGGTGPRCVTRRVWVGDPPLELVRAQAERYRRAAPAGLWLSTTGGAIQLTSGPADELADELAQVLYGAGGTHLALKVDVLGVPHHQAMDQIAALADVLPQARTGMAAAA